MLRKFLTATVAALALIGATLAPMQSAQAGGLGKAIAIGILGTAGGAIAAGSAARAQQDQGYRSDDRLGGYRPDRGYDEGCGFRIRPVFDEYGNKVGVRCVPDY